MKIGVIGGNGVAATNRLLDMIEQKITVSGAFRDAHHPDMLVAQATQVPSRSMFLEGRGEDWRPAYIELAKGLKHFGCDIACMCCNTAHYAIDDIVRGSGLPFINLLDEVSKAVRTLKLKKVELWVSDGARKFDIYRPSLQRYVPECEIIYPSELRQRDVTNIICSVKTKARFLSEDDPAHPLFKIRTLLESRDAPVVLGCTDIRVAYQSCPKLDEGIVVDSLECLANSIVQLFEKEKEEMRA